MPARSSDKQPRTKPRVQQPAYAPLSITGSGVLDAVSQPVHLQVWESIRRFRRAVTAAEVATSARMPMAQVQSTIDTLHSAGLLELVPASRGQRAIRWKTNREQILLTYRRDLPEEELLQRKMQHLFDATQRDLRAKIKPRTARTNRDFHWNSVDAAQLTVSEVNEIYELLQKVTTVLRRAKARVAALDSSASVDSNYFVSMDVEPLLEGALPLPTMQCIGSTAESKPAHATANASETKLTARERDVAVQLAAGASRAEVSRQLGISPHTVTEFTRRIYRKLGVNNRARLAAKLTSDA
jgi:DNA-binding CsgD family transcriptional regulator